LAKSEIISLFNRHSLAVFRFVAIEKEQPGQERDMKKRLDVRIEEELRDGLDQRAEQSSQQLTAIVERYITEGLARDAGKLVEIQSLPEIRAAVRDETTRAIGQLYQQLVADLAKANKRDTERLAKMGSNTWRDAGIAWRLLYALLSHMVGGDKARDWYEDAKAKAGKALKSAGDDQ
jgi:hypothetical protein